VVSEPAKASPSLYSTITRRSENAPGRPKNSRNGSTTASRSVRGGGATLPAGSLPQTVAMTPMLINAAIAR